MDDHNDMYLLQIMFEGIPVDVTDPSRLYRGFIAVDKIQHSPGSHCRGFCTFTVGFCDWGNDQGDDFDWALVSELVYVCTVCLGGLRLSHEPLQAVTQGLLLNQPG
jgi:hypothetical protein